MTIEDIESLAKRRGFFWQSAEIYGGMGGFYDYGHLGTIMKRKIENLWRKYFLSLDDRFFEIETSNIMPESVFVASGHLQSFVDPVTRCEKCNTPHRADHIIEQFLGQRFEGVKPEELERLITKHDIKCPKCKGPLKAAVDVFNMMFPVTIGVEGGTKAYLRPETAQGVYVNFLQNFDILRKRLPIGLAIIGRAYRNEISPRQLITRMREFTQAELQIFFDPEKIDSHERWYEVEDYKLLLLPAGSQKIMEITAAEAAKSFELPQFYLWHLAKIQQFFLEKLGIPKERFRVKELSEEERAFYNKIHFDIEIDTPSLGGWKEIGGLHYRTDHDLVGHQKVSKKSQNIFFDGKKFIPHVLEISMGIDRILFTLLDLNLVKNTKRSYLRLPPAIAPYTLAIFPLVKKDGLDKIAKELFLRLKKRFDVFYDEDDSIGRRYARVDEIGTPFAITIDNQTKEDNTVTIRDRDTTKQQRIEIEKIEEYIEKYVL